MRLTKSQWLFVVAFGLLAAVAVRWFAAPSTQVQANDESESSQAEPKEVPVTPVASVEHLPLPALSTTVTESAPSEVALMQRLRSVKGSNPSLAIDLAREGNRRFPDSSDAPERASVLIHALAQLERGAEARGEAEQMVNHYPDSQWVREIEGFTGAHRHRNLRVNDAGQLEQYDP